MHILRRPTTNNQPERAAGAPPPLLHILQPGEIVQAHTRAADVLIAVTSQRLIVADDDRTLLDIAFSQLRRVQFDIERGRSATLVIVPEQARDEPQVIAVPIAKLAEVAAALALLGQRLNEDAESDVQGPASGA
jgi:hypothetical protein